MVVEEESLVQSASLVDLDLIVPVLTQSSTDSVDIKNVKQKKKTIEFEVKKEKKNKKKGTSILKTKSSSSKKSRKVATSESNPEIEVKVKLEPEGEVEHKRKKNNETNTASSVQSMPNLVAEVGKTTSTSKKAKKSRSRTVEENTEHKNELPEKIEPGQFERELLTNSQSNETIIILSNITPKSRERKKKTVSPNNDIETTKSKSKSTHSSSPSKHRRKKKKRSHAEYDDMKFEENSASSDDEDFCGDFFMDSMESKNSDYVCLTESDIIAEQAREIEYVSDILSISPSLAIALLKHFKWNKDKLLTSYFDNPAKVLKESGINLTDENMISEKSMQMDYESLECSICGDEYESQEFHSIKPCLHGFCKMCWNEYLSMKIKEGQAAYICCPQYKCLSLVQEPTVKLHVDEEMYRKYCMFLMKSFVEDNENVKWCPAPNCGNAVTSDMISQRKTVSCKCSYRFCFQCSEEAHLPATCEQLKLWKKKCEDESETQNWIAANTQECPKCLLPTEKNGGCNHMTCRQCKYEYCWICLKDWKGHNDFYTCNRYQKKEEKQKTKKGSKKEREQQRIEMRRALEKYLHYYSRYMNHARSSELERVRDKAMRKMHEMQETEATSAEVLFIKQATDRLIECRSVLKYTYVFHYYLPDCPQKDLFEYLQEDLEKTAEFLSEALENPMKNKMTVVNLTVLAETRLNNLLDAVDSAEFLSVTSTITK